MNLSYRKIAKVALLLVYLVIVAGAVVRMTGSGMGCPDWPKCFGYYIPPTDSAALEWRPNFEFMKGQVIINDEQLFVARSRFITQNTIDLSNWEPYTKHDYATFNVWHTWIEYLNRLLGALAGLATLVLAIWSIPYWKKDKRLVLGALLVVIGMGFQAWLGATVVYSVLEPVKITLHMLMALAIVALLIGLIKRSGNDPSLPMIPKGIRLWVFVALGLTLVQIVMGTQVRQFVDHQIDLVGEQAKALWLANPSLSFYLHRSFSIAVVLVNSYLFWNNKKQQLGLHKLRWVMFIIGLEIATGIAMYYVDFPFGTQPLHLVLASLLFGVQFYLVLEVVQAKERHKTL
ncbi:MAG: COX15/CtaA family protein [Bacteroidota bacterium]